MLIVSTNMTGASLRVKLIAASAAIMLVGRSSVVPGYTNTPAFPGYPLDGSGKPIRLYGGTYTGLHHGKPVRLQIVTIGNYAYATWIRPGVDRECMIAETYELPPKGLEFVPGWPDDYKSPTAYRDFAVDAVPVFALEQDGLIVKILDGGGPLEHLRRVASHADVADMYATNNDGNRESCLPRRP